jgi:predicted nuclease of predicted toxin-antitoxin system
MLLLDENLPASLLSLLRKRFPGSTHVRLAGLVAASDREVWNHAKANGLAIVSKDGDFRQLAFAEGNPPKTIWLRCGNSSVAELRTILERSTEDIARFLADTELSLLLVG